MPAKAIDNANLINHTGVMPSGFTPAVTFTYNSGTGAVVVTDGSTIPAGDSLKKVHVKVHDKFGGQVNGTITATGGGGAQTLDCSGLNATKGLDIRATVLTTLMIAADGNASNIGAAGSIANWDTQRNA